MNNCSALERWCRLSHPECVERCAGDGDRKLYVAGSTGARVRLVFTLRGGGVASSVVDSWNVERESGRAAGDSPMSAVDAPGSLARRAAVHAALGDPARLAMVDELAVSDRSPKELGAMFGLGSNLLSHHLDVLEHGGLIERVSSAGDGRRKYVRLQRSALEGLGVAGRSPRGEMVFLCTQNSARSQLAAAMWTARTGRPASSAGTQPARRVHRGAVAAARRAGLSLVGAAPRAMGAIASGAQVVTVCDLVHEELTPEPHWWHWSIPDPVAADDDGAFDAVIAELDARIAGILPMDVKEASA